jgi:hypothetical protein
MILVIIIFFVITFTIFYLLDKLLYKNIDKYSNRFTNDTCCTEKQKENCMTYGKTGVCNYYKNNKSCLCQNANT